MSTALNNSTLQSVQPLKTAFGYVGQRPVIALSLDSLRTQFSQQTAANDPSMPADLHAQMVDLTVNRITAMIRDPELSADDALDMMKSMADEQPQLFYATSRQVCQEFESHGYDFHARALAGTMAKKGIHIDLVSRMSFNDLAR